MINATQAMANMRRRPGTPDRGSSQHVRAEEQPHQTPELILRVEADTDEARVHVIDSGPGIAPERLDEIFRPYVSHRVGGSGLGLPTARRIIEEHGGRIDVHSTPGVGSDFVIRLPVKDFKGAV
jgi:signal transduction histidine kinase